MALLMSMGSVALNQWRASSPTLDPRTVPAELLQRFRHLRWALARRSGPRSSDRVCWIRAWAKL